MWAWLQQTVKQLTIQTCGVDLCRTGDVMVRLLDMHLCLWWEVCRMNVLGSYVHSDGNELEAHESDGMDDCYVDSSENPA